MSRARQSHLTASDPSKETPRMPKRLVSLAALVGALLLLIVPSSASATSPWWQILDGARPSHMWEPSSESEVQELEVTEKLFGAVAAIKIELGGEVVGCLGSGTFFKTADEFCEEATTYDADETAAELEATLEAAYGGDVEVSGGPAGVAPFEVTTPGRWVEPLQLTPVNFFGFDLGNARAEVLSEDSGNLVITVTNLGDAPVDAVPKPGSPVEPVEIVDKLPDGVVAYAAQGSAGIRVQDQTEGDAGPVECAIEAPDEVLCSFEGVLFPYAAIEIEVSTVLTGSPPDAAAPGAQPGEITVSGGSAPSASGAQRIEVSPDPVPFGIERFSAEAEEEGGAPARQAGGHPFQFTTTLQLNAGRFINKEDGVEQPALPRNLEFPLPPGFVGNATIAPQCDMVSFFHLNPANFTNDCSDETVIGAGSVTIAETSLFGLTRIPSPVFNLPPAHGEPARFGLMPLGVPVTIDTAFDPDTHRITAAVSNVTQLAQFLASTTSLWGTPGDPRHDTSRGWGCVYQGTKLEESSPPCERPASLSEEAFARMPANCDSPLSFGMRIEPWNVPLGSVFDEAFDTSEPLLGCNKVPFDPSIAAAPTSKLAESSSGLSFNLTMPNANLTKASGIAESQPKKAEVALPEGMTLNPSASEGLAVCTPADYARERFNSRPGAGCPDASKIGNVTIETPLLFEQVRGALYLAAPHDNPFDSLLALYIVARVPERGILVKLAGKVSPDPRTGQLLTTFDEVPQLPFSSFDLSFREGGRAPLVTPPACGSYDVVAKFVPWSAQDPNNPRPEEIVTRTSSFTVQRGVDGGACPAGGIPPFEPEFEAGSLNNNAKSYSPFYMRLVRHDGEQDMTKFSSILPPGVLGKLAGVAKCPEGAIEATKAKSGSEELASPSCPIESQIGRTSAGAGVGSVLTYVGGKVYLAGSYKGAPLSVVAVVPAVAGPFDVGTVVTREGLTLNPETAEVEVDGAASDPIPHILAGIPLKVRDLRVYVDRDNFILNPTSCDESSAKATLFGSYLDLFSSADDVPVALATRYQAANCLNLGFKPKLGLKLKGGTKRGDFPGLRATLRARGSDANVAAAQVTLPRSAFLEQGHIGTICTRVQFKAESCPKASVYGHARAITPLLDEPIEGPVYMRSSNHKLPDLVIVLKGIVDVNVSSRIDSFKGGLRSTFDAVPDAPISSFVLTMKGGKKGLIVNSRNLCAARNKASVAFTGHNGRVANLRPEMVPQCRKARKRK
jgi:hypothetical protein